MSRKETENAVALVSPWGPEHDQLGYTPRSSTPLRGGELGPDKDVRGSRGFRFRPSTGISHSYLFLCAHCAKYGSRLQLFSPSTVMGLALGKSK